jgi:probable HAF family extracellular repeat protein
MKAPLAMALMAAFLCASAYASDGITPGKFKLTIFDVAGTPSGYGGLGVESINDAGIIVGYSDASPEIGFIREKNGGIKDLADPLSNGSFQFTQADGINSKGTVVGYFYDTANSQYSGFFYQNGEFTTYNIPGLPKLSDTAVLGINDSGAFVGFYEVPPAYALVPFVNTGGHIDTDFKIPSSTLTEPVAINKSGQIAGLFIDKSKAYHGFFRAENGAIKVIDVPGSGALGGYVLGLNDSGWMSGHFWDKENHEHGFLRSPGGQFYQIDVPGANTTTAKDGTGGGGLNNDGVVVGHFDPDNGSIEKGYIAIPEFSLGADEKKDE